MNDLNYFIYVCKISKFVLERLISKYMHKIMFIKLLISSLQMRVCCIIPKPIC